MYACYSEAVFRLKHPCIPSLCLIFGQKTSGNRERKHCTIYQLSVFPMVCHILVDYFRKTWYNFYQQRKRDWSACRKRGIQ